MPKIDLITGFLGSGKTTFLKRYAQYFIERKQNIGILENDFGAVNVDTMLLKELEGDLCELEAVAGGCDYDCHRRRFKTKLIAMGMVGYERVLVEPSGIYDTDEFFDVLYEEPLDSWYKIGSVIAVVDAKLEKNLSEEADYLLACQIANAGAVVLSRTQMAKPEEIDQTIRHLNRVMEKFGCRRRFFTETARIAEAAASDYVLAKDWAAFTEEDFEGLRNAGYRSEDHLKLPVEKENAFDSLYFMHAALTPEELKERAMQILADSACGHVFRLKGFLKTENGWLQLNAKHDAVQTEPAKEGQEVIIVIGENLKEDKITHILES